MPPFKYVRMPYNFHDFEISNSPVTTFDNVLFLSRSKTFPPSELTKFLVRQTRLAIEPDFFLLASLIATRVPHTTLRLLI